MPRKTIAILVGAGAAVAAAILAVVKKRDGKGAAPVPSTPGTSASEPATGGPDAEAAREIAGEPTSPADVPSVAAAHHSEPVNEAMDEIAGEPTSPADVPGAGQPPSAEQPTGAEQPTEVRPPAGEKPTGPTGTDAPSNPAVEPGNHAADGEPHHALNTPVGDPDPTEWPDPYEKRDDPRDPADADVGSVGDEPHTPTGAESTSEPPPSEDPEAGERARPPQRDKLDD